MQDDMSQDEKVAVPDNTAVRTALWRALHVEIDSPPHVLEDNVGMQLVGPVKGWRNRQDMSPFTKPFRASILARARFVEDLIVEQAERGVGQYVILDAGCRPDRGCRGTSILHEDRRPSNKRCNWL